MCHVNNGRKIVVCSLRELLIRTEADQEAWQLSFEQVVIHAFSKAHPLLIFTQAETSYQNLYLSSPNFSKLPISECSLLLLFPPHPTRTRIPYSQDDQHEANCRRDVRR